MSLLMRALLFFGLVSLAIGCGDLSIDADGESSADDETLESVELGDSQSVGSDDVIPELVEESSEADYDSMLLQVDEGHEADFLDLLNQERASEGLNELDLFWDLENSARDHSQTMASENDLHHNPNLGSVTDSAYWTSLGENVGVGPSVSSIHSALMASQGHYDNIMGDFSHVGVGVVVDGSQIWVTFVFMNAAVSELPPPPSSGSATPGWYLNNTMYGGSADIDFVYGRDDDEFIVGDWNGDGRMTPGVIRGSKWYLTNSPSGGAADYSFHYGRADDEALVGDWNGDGRMTPGIRRGSEWHLTNSPSGGPSDYSFHYGWASDEVLVGDWNGDGRMTPGILRGSEWHLTNSPSGGPADYSFNYGRSSDDPIVGDWNGNGTMTTGVIRTD